MQSNQEISTPTIFINYSKNNKAQHSSYKEISSPQIFINDSQSNNTLDEESDQSSMLIDRSFLRTPHPKKYTNENDLMSERHPNRIYIKKSDFNLTTRDISFVSGDTCENKNFRNYTSKNSTNKNNLNLFEAYDSNPFKHYENVSDYFINFTKLKRESLNDRNSLTYDPQIRLDDTISIDNNTPEFRMLSGENEQLDEIEILSKKSQSEDNDFYSDKKNKALCHHLLPYYRKDDEEYKIKMIAEMKIHKYHTDTHKFIIFRKRKLNELENVPQLDFSILKKTRISSVKKVYQSILPLFGEKEEIKAFPIYRDDDIGIKSNWRGHLRLQELDNDQESDEEIRLIATDQSLNFIKDAIKEVKLKKNFSLQRRSYSYK